MMSSKVGSTKSTGGATRFGGGASAAPISTLGTAKRKEASDGNAGMLELLIHGVGVLKVVFILESVHFRPPRLC